MADDDNFDIDIYGDDAPQEENTVTQADTSLPARPAPSEDNAQQSSTDVKLEKMDTGPSALPPPPIPEPSPAPQGIKRKASMDDRPIDPNSSHAVQVTELHWWITEDDVRGWCARSGAEAELRDLTFNEHKVNGKSKGQVYLEFSSQAAATAAKQYIDVTDSIKDPKRPKAEYFHGPSNPYKTMPKDSARRTDGRGADRPPNTGSTTFGSQNNNFAGGNNFRGRGNYNNNRGGNTNMGYNRGGFQGNMNPMPNMAPVMQQYGGMNPGFNNFNRGGMMGGGMRGGMPMNRGRGGMMGGPSPGMMGGPMAGMNMGNMAMGGMGMPGGMMGMGGVFQPQQAFNAGGFYQGQNTGAGDWNNMHPAKRARPNE